MYSFHKYFHCYNHLAKQLQQLDERQIIFHSGSDHWGRDHLDFPEWGPWGPAAGVHGALQAATCVSVGSKDREVCCYGLNCVPSLPQIRYVEALLPSVTVFGEEALGGDWGD